ncbi:MAG: hypothetical protein II584_03365 [Treponema sp.]|nr:hypothetical protein [Treponema sp.]
MAENIKIADESVSSDVATAEELVKVDLPVESVAVDDAEKVSAESVREEDSEESSVKDDGDVSEVEAASDESLEVESEEAEKPELAVDRELLQILNAQNDVLDCMLTQQKKIHDSVRDRRWTDLEESINNMRAYSDAFVNLDQCRESYVGDNRALYLVPGIQDVYVSLRTKLSKSKIENMALATYVSSTKEFVDGVIENCVPQSRARVYGRNGRVMSPTAESVVLDALV